MRAVILAGGKGRRLEPYTTIIPKPLMPIGDKPTLEIILRQLQGHGVRDVTIAVGHLAELIMAFFGDGSRFGLSITYSWEERPLGTAGCLGLIKNDLAEPFLMMNGDVLTTLPFSKFMDFHQRSGAVATVALNKRNYFVDFGIVDTDGDENIVGYTEKPGFEHFVSMGIYAFDPKVLEYIPSHEYIDFPDLIKVLLAAGETIKAYKYDGYWLDIGRFDDYKKANNEIAALHGTLGVGDE
ncbi:MAG: sugar phosphate nucleotidyltransferase [Methanoculleus sp.]|uniref:sugar phosphate nucleotidyltransferase n=1 Tax=unclassified Methanoculleus TaxID=2619537 RepID=UPI0025E47A95|nr:MULTISPECIES: sugar phosphate nucleotidyltransferase [unclassified Methanoculleus]MCK9297342.1 sugar phosphate nucleotidyltransferase [Methanoculleus sp.]MDD2254041.1 sugar phosphate nucleotidyltransferase [Methanoculleus sp.]MDD3216454.1 sugar phosphate nucleotidyltransferase [Methanoculleus sp.]MDD4313350.1 sugar phosphate nucleotidyltransferase [Methanoculleus sp.]MDD4470909.1 sugar phosphate nucleotidyltransferase [Methanoculleus sp.]